MNKTKQTGLALEFKNLSFWKRIKHAFNVILGRKIIILGNVENHKKVSK